MRMLFIALVLSLTALPASPQLASRPLKMPKLRAGERCPVSKGSHETVPDVSYIFCARCLWFGSSPVDFAWAYRLGDGDDALFDLHKVPHDRSGYSAKTPWVARFDFSGPILVRGRQIDGNGKLRFSAVGPKLSDKFELTAPNKGAPDQWSFWPADMSVPHPGCYAIQIDTSVSSEVVVFRADDHN